MRENRWWFSSLTCARCLDHTVDCHNIVAEELWEHARIRFSWGKIRVFTKGGEVSDGQALQIKSRRPQE